MNESEQFKKETYSRKIGILRYLQKILNYIPIKKKNHFYMLLIGMVFLAIVEISTLGILSVYATLISVPDDLMNSQLFKRIFKILNCSGNISIESTTYILSILVILSVVAKNVLTYFIRMSSARYEAFVQSYFGERMLENLLKTKYEWYLNENPNEILHTLALKTQIGAFIRSALMIFSNIILVLFMLIGVIAVQPTIMLIMIVIVSSSSYLVYKIMRQTIDKNSRQAFNWSIAQSLDASKTVFGMKDVRIFGLEKQFHSDYSKKSYQFSYHCSIESILSSIPSWIMETVGFVFLALSVILMTFIMNLSKVEVFSTLTILAVTAWKILPAINRIITNLGVLRSNFPFIDQIYHLLANTAKYQKQNDYLPLRYSDDQLDHTEQETSFSQKFELQDISFKYTDSEYYAIQDISFVVNRGDSIGIIGHSGAGKSTLVDVIIGLLEPDRGKIIVDGEQLNTLHDYNWRRFFGYVHQFPYIYDCTLAENIAFGEELKDIDEEKIYSTCCKASIDFLDTLKDGIHSRIGERGLTLSGGQKQRLTIARALYRNPEILILDEATSSLDTKNEGIIRTTIDNLKGSQTMIIIAHRLSSVYECDKIIWLENGKIVDIGSPTNILPQYERYSES